VAVFVQSSVLPRYYTWQGESREDLMFFPFVGRPRNSGRQARRVPCALLAQGTASCTADNDVDHHDKDKDQDHDKDRDKDKDKDHEKEQDRDR
jgi:hypothetical protein